MVVGSTPIAATSTSDFAPVSNKEFLDIQATIESRFTLKRLRDMIRTYNSNPNLQEKDNSSMLKVIVAAELFFAIK